MALMESLIEKVTFDQTPKNLSGKPGRRRFQEKGKMSLKELRLRFV